MTTLHMSDRAVLVPDTLWESLLTATHTLGLEMVAVPAAPGQVRRYRVTTITEPITVIASPASALTKRELQVLVGMSRGMSNSRIGRELGLTEDTVKTHARRMFRKLGVQSRAQAVHRGHQLGILITSKNIQPVQKGLS